MSEKGKELQDKIFESTVTLIEKIKAGGSQNYLDYLKWASRFHRYSYGNQLLIWSQNREATHVAGFHTWRKMGYMVNKGEHGMKILVPYKFKRGVNADGEEVQGLAFGPGTVFDIAQTNCPPDAIPSVFKKVSHPELFAATLAAMKADGITVETNVNTGRAEGTSSGGLVKLNDESLSTLVHEYAHEVAHWKEEAGKGRTEWTARQREIHAEGIAYVVCSALGVEIEHSSDYIINWSNGAEDFQAEMNVIMKCAKLILERIQKHMKVTEVEEEVAA